MSITAAQVKELREQTGAGMMDAKNALVEAGGDMDKAVELLRQKGLATAAKKSGRQAAEGLVHAEIQNNGKIGALVEVNCETDFVARGDAFTDMVRNLAAKLVETKAQDVDAFLKKPSGELAGDTIHDYVTEKIGQIKENLQVRRFALYERIEPGLIHAYIHTGGKIGVLAELACQKDETAGKPDFQQLAKDVCMQVASAAAEFVTTDDIPQSVVEEEKRVEMGKEDLQNKPEDIRAKIVEGRVQKLLSQRVLVEQPFIKDPGKTVGELLKEISGSLGDDIGVVRFTRYVLGEGIEKEEKNFAEEVMAQLK